MIYWLTMVFFGGLLGASIGMLIDAIRKWNKKRKTKMKAEKAKVPREYSSSFLSVEEHQPIPGAYYYCYTDIFGIYAIAKYNPVTGWIIQNGEGLKSVTHFWDVDLPMPFAIRNEFSKEKAKAYGMHVEEDSS